jgi:hypothetical protein
MDAQVTSARGIEGGRHGIAGRLGKGPVIGVAIFSLIVATLLASQVLPGHGSVSRDPNTTNMAATGPGVSTAQYYDDLMAQQEDYIHTMAARATMRQAATQYDDLMSQQEDFLHTMAARADALATAATSFTDGQQRMCFDGSAVLLTCYTRQPDGRWQRTEMQEDTTWVVVGKVTYDEMQAAIAAANARAS